MAFSRKLLARSQTASAKPWRVANAVIVASLRPGHTNIFKRSLCWDFKLLLNVVIRNPEQQQDSKDQHVPVDGLYRAS